MAFAQGSRHRLAYVPETVFGTTPATPSMKSLRITDTTLNLAKQINQSGEIRSDRGISDLRHGTFQVGGDINFELQYGTFDEWLEAALFGTWSSNVLKTGVAMKSFTLERGQLDNTDYLIYTGCVPSALSLTIPMSGMVTGTLSVVGKGFSVAGSQLGVPAAAPTNPPMESASGSITEGGSPIASINSLSLSLDNGVEPNFVVGSHTAAQLAYGRANLTGTVSAYFENTTLLEKFVDETESSLGITLEDPNGNQLAISVPRIKYTGGDVPLNTEKSLQINMPFQALLDSSTSSTLTITRTAA